MPGKMIENIIRGIAVEAQDMRAAGSLYNGQAAGSGTYIDTMGYDEITFSINAGVVGAGNSLALRVLQNTSDAVDAAEAITGAAFTTLTDSTDQTPQYASIKCSTYNRYMWVESFKTGTGSANIGVSYEMSQGIRPVSNSPVFDLDQEP